ncbi:polysaccharide biosynthesis PFTS motif protein [Leptospira stimsonii]|uniref:Polysaccharide biosynthesis PFTS motif protein n=1 Tax=Leptospira stimsonii TaxID=2202203 RepID=A0ABY2MVX0_9LEPT|nr:polysaccharide biosynthesis PFTS motif protein [Leptospira stimsonii]TGM09983.1 polysaccharide biosynthesis PFTS motif protein [Leptospira stimsonii]
MSFSFSTEKLKLNSNHCNLSFDQEIQKVFEQLLSRLPSFLGYSSQVLTERLTQRVIEIGRLPFTLTSKYFYEKEEKSIPIGYKLDCGRAEIEIGSGVVSVSWKQWLYNQAEFILHWAYCFLNIFRISFYRNSLPATLVFGVGEESLFIEKSDRRFVEYCRSGQIPPLKNGKWFLIQSFSGNISSNPSEFSYVKNPLLNLLSETRLGFLGRVELLINHSILIFLYSYLVFRFRSLSLIAKDFAYIAILASLDKRQKIQEIFLTCSSFGIQPLWMRSLKNAETNMIWYAQNWQPIVTLPETKKSNIPFLRWIRVDRHWVWTHSFAGYLKTLSPKAKIESVGPIVWYSPDALVKPPVDAIQITVFDISPYSDEIALEYCEFPNYNCPDNLNLFIEDILSLKKNLEKKYSLPVRVRLKTKRGYRSSYDRQYFNTLEKLDRKGGINLLYHMADVFNLISESHLIIVYPFSSPAYIAEHLKIPAIYYDPTSSILRWDFADSESWVHFAHSRKELESLSVRELNKSFA